MQISVSCTIPSCYIFGHERAAIICNIGRGQSGSSEPKIANLCFTSSLHVTKICRRRIDLLSGHNWHSGVDWRVSDRDEARQQNVEPLEREASS
jgi:hypothetical protein